MSAVAEIQIELLQQNVSRAQPSRQQRILKIWSINQPVDFAPLKQNQLNAVKTTKVHHTIQQAHPSQLLLPVVAGSFFVVVDPVDRVPQRQPSIETSSHSVPIQSCTCVRVNNPPTPVLGYKSLSTGFLFIQCSPSSSFDGSQAGPSLATHGFQAAATAIRVDSFTTSKALVPEAPLVLDYHGGPLLTGKGALQVYVIWYGSFAQEQQTIIRDFFDSFSAPSSKPPSVASWWSIASRYKDSRGKSVFPTVKLAKEIHDSYSSGKHLNRNGTQELVISRVLAGHFPLSHDSLYLVLTSKDVTEHGFCSQSCGYHRHTNASLEPPKDPTMAYAWVGDSSMQCAGRCAWPFAHPRDFFGPDKEPLLPPNGDVGVDGMLINIATVLAGAATNPYMNGYWQGHQHSHLGAATACAGIYGKGAFPGHPGELLVDSKTGASYNAVGARGRKFLLPAIWDPATKKCALP